MARLVKQNHESFAATLRATLPAVRQESNVRSTRVGAKFEDGTRQSEANTNMLEAMQTRIDALESNDSPSSSGGHKDQNSGRAVATGFTESFADNGGKA